MGSRERILARLGSACGHAAVAPDRHRLPAGHGDPVAAFIERVPATAATVERVNTYQEIVAAVQRYCRGHDLGESFAAAPALRYLDWGQQGLAPCFGNGDARDRLAVSEAYAGIAETASVVMLSGDATPTRLNFLPEYQIIIIPAQRIVWYPEAIWKRLREQQTPRAVNIITGPSRTADIEQTLTLGAHGPRFLHLLVKAGTLTGYSQSASRPGQQQASPKPARSADVPDWHLSPGSRSASPAPASPRLRGATGSGSHPT